MDPHAELHARIERLCRRADAEQGTGVLEEMDRLLSEGYARALLEERRVGELDERLVELVADPDGGGGHELRSLAGQRRTAASAVERLRAHLAVMHHRYLVHRTA